MLLGGVVLCLVAAIAYVVLQSDEEETVSSQSATATNALPNDTDESPTDVVQGDGQELSDFTRQDSAALARISTSTNESNQTVPVEKTGVKYIEVVQSCNHAWQGDCIVARANPSVDAATTSRLRTGMVLRVDGEVENDDGIWYRVLFDDQPIRYPERITTDWFILADGVELSFEDGVINTWENEAPTTTAKQIVVDISDQKLYAYDGETLFMETVISTGLELSPTSIGTFRVFKKMPSRYMQGPIEGAAFSDEYDLSGVPWNLYFTEGGEVIHGTYWHDNFGNRHSHGCVNLQPQTAKKLYEWATLNTEVIVQN